MAFWIDDVDVLTCYQICKLMHSCTFFYLQFRQNTLSINTRHCLSYCQLYYWTNILVTSEEKKICAHLDHPLCNKLNICPTVHTFVKSHEEGWISSLWPSSRSVNYTAPQRMFFLTLNKYVTN